MPKLSIAQRRLVTLAQVLETDLPALESFLDLLGEEPLTDRRIIDAQWVMGLCTPIASRLQFPKMEPPSIGKELFAEWQQRRQFLAAPESVPPKGVSRP